MEKLIGSLTSKTSWFALIIIVLGALQQNAEAVTAVVGAGNIGWVMSGIGVVIYALRWVTTAALGAPK